MQKIYYFVDYEIILYHYRFVENLLYWSVNYEQIVLTTLCLCELLIMQKQGSCIWEWGESILSEIVIWESGNSYIVIWP